MRLFPIWTALMAFFILCVGFFFMLMTFYDPTYQNKMNELFVGTFFTCIPILVLNMKISSSVFLTLARGTGNLDDGHARARRTQSIAPQDIRQELENYVLEAGGVENITFDTFLLRLRIVDPDTAHEGEQGETIVKLGLASERLARVIFEDAIKEACDAALADAGLQIDDYLEFGEGILEDHDWMFGTNSKGGRTKSTYETRSNRTKKKKKRGITLPPPDD